MDARGPTPWTEAVPKRYGHGPSDIRRGTQPPSCIWHAAKGTPTTVYTVRMAYMMYIMYMAVITMVQWKGGVGKSTLAVHFAVALGAVLIDLEPWGGATAWWAGPHAREGSTTTARRSRPASARTLARAAPGAHRWRRFKSSRLGVDS